MSRPGQALILSLGGMIAIALPRDKDRPDFAATPAVACLKCGAILMLATIALSYHLKGVLYAVIAAVCLAVCARGPQTRVPRLVAGAVLAVLTFAAFRYWSARFACPGDPELARAFAGQNLAALLGNGGEIVSALPRLVANALPILYVVPAIPSPEPISAWLPPHVFSPTLSLSFRVIMLAMWAAAGGFVLFAAVCSVASRGLARVLEPRFAIAATILACLLVWGFSQVTKNMYETAHVLPLLALAMVLAIGSSGAVPRRVLSGLAVVALASALVSQIVVVTVLARPFANADASRGALPDQPLSLAVFRFGKTDDDIVRAMRAAGMPTARAPADRRCDLPGVATQPPAASRPRRVRAMARLDCRSGGLSDAPQIVWHRRAVRQLAAALPGGGGALGRNLCGGCGPA